MKHGLNFNRSLFILFLSFVSFQDVGAKESPTSEGVKDDFALFESSEDSTPVKKSPASSDVEQLKTEIRKDPKKLDLIVRLAEAYVEKGDFEKATLLLWKQVDKLDRNALLVLARAHESRKEPLEMIRALNILIAKNAKDVEALTLMGNAYLLQKKNKDAMESYKSAVEINSKYEPAYRGLIDLYEKRTPPNLYELRILFQDMIDNIGPRFQYYSKLCEINTMDSTYEPAIQSCNSAIAKNANVADPYVYLGLSYRATGEEQKGIQALKKAANKFPDSELAQFSYAKALEEQKNYVDAMKVYKAGTDANKKSARSWLGLANSAFEIRKYEVALLAFSNSCKYEKKNAAAFRKAAAILRNARTPEWSERFVTAAEGCGY